MNARLKFGLVAVSLIAVFLGLAAVGLGSFAALSLYRHHQVHAAPVG